MVVLGVLHVGIDYAGGVAVCVVDSPVGVAVVVAVGNVEHVSVVGRVVGCAVCGVFFFSTT